MHKLLLPLAGIGGLATVSVGGYVLIKSGESTNVQPTQKETFRKKYPHAILGSSDNLWDSKFKAIKGSGQPTHPKLKDSKIKSGTVSIEVEAKVLHKQGCEEIYNSELENSPYLKDFENYCAKTVKDMAVESGTWVDSEISGTAGEWDPKLVKLKALGSDQNKALDEGLRNLKDKLAGVSENQWTEEHRRDLRDLRDLRDWCENLKYRIFMGKEDNQFTNSKLYCVKD